jgi:hypothetical protein
MFKLISLLSFLTLLTNVSSSNTTAVKSFKYKSCGTSNDIAQNIIMNVNPTLPQTDYTFELGGDLSKEITGGTSKYIVTYNFIPLTPTVNDLCTEINASNITCPLKQGVFGIKSNGVIPSGLSGSSTIKNEWFNIDNARILCVLFTITN